MAARSMKADLSSGLGLRTTGLKDKTTVALDRKEGFQTGGLLWEKAVKPCVDTVQCFKQVAGLNGTAQGRTSYFLAMTEVESTHTHRSGGAP